MANPGWMWHFAQGKQLFPDLTPAFQKRLEGDGWFDSPDKMREAAAKPKGPLDELIEDHVVVHGIVDDKPQSPFLGADEISEIPKADVSPGDGGALQTDPTDRTHSLGIDLETATKAELQGWLDDRGIAYKARDSREALVDLVLAAPTNPE